MVSFSLIDSTQMFSETSVSLVTWKSALMFTLNLNSFTVIGSVPADSTACATRAETAIAVM